jgi:hypothetical protein
MSKNFSLDETVQSAVEPRFAVLFPEISQFVAQYVHVELRGWYHNYRYTFVTKTGSGANTNCKPDVTKPSTNKWLQLPENRKLRSEVLG